MIDSSMLSFLAPCFAASLILAGIHAYLGVHVVERGVIFVDLALSKATSESEHLKDMLVGNILAVSWAEVGKTAVLYGVIGAFHFVFRHKFLAISMNHQKAEDSGLNVKFWDFLFYASFGFVVT